MELTYNNMKQWIVDYYNALFSIKGKGDRSKIKALLAPDYKVHPAGTSAVLNRDEWVNELCSHIGKYQLNITYDAYQPMGISIDERRGWASVIMQEEYLDPVTKKEVKPNKNMFVFFKFCVHDNKVKAQGELIIGITGSLKGVW